MTEPSRAEVDVLKHLAEGSNQTVPELATALAERAGVEVSNELLYRLADPPRHWIVVHLWRGVWRVAITSRGLDQVPVP